MNLEDLRHQVRIELAGYDPALAQDAAEVDRQVREVIEVLSAGADHQMNAARLKADAAVDPRYRELWLRRAERLRQGVVALEAVLNELCATLRDREGQAHER